jgi:sugar/nucleoside kinase (ribokinase family)
MTSAANAKDASSLIILGDAFADVFCFLDGDLPQEAGGDTRLTHPIRTAAGGSGLNTATHFRGLLNQDDDDVRVCLYTALNDTDPYGLLLGQHAHKHEISLRNCAEPHTGKSTGHCAVLVTNGERSFLTHLGVMESFDAQQIDVDSICASPAPFMHVHVAGYFNIPGFWGGKVKQTLRQIKDRIQEEDRKVVTSLLCQYDATEQWDGQLLDLLPIVDYLFVNELEATNIARANNKNTTLHQLTDEQNEDTFLNGMATLFYSISPRTCIVVTLGPRGACALKGGTVVARQPTPMAVDNPVDPTGAGDAFIAGFLYGIQSNKETKDDSLSTIARGLLYGCAVGTSCVMRPGASNPASREEIDAVLAKTKESI